MTELVETPSALGTTELAAIVLVSMGEEQAAEVLRCLSRDELLAVTKAMSGVSGLKVGKVQDALQLFFEHYRDQSGVHGASRTFLERALQSALGPEIAHNVLNNIYGDSIRAKMARLEWVSPRWLAHRIMGEHDFMQALFLAFLPASLASQVLDALPAEHRQRILLSLARMSDVDRDLMIELDEIVDACLQDLGMQGANVDGVKHAAEIINRMPGDRAQLIEEMRQADAGIAGVIEVSMYDFFVLSRQNEAALIRIFEAVEAEQWAVALKGAEPVVRDAILGAIPRRQVQALEDSMRRSGPVPLSRIEEARREIMTKARSLAAAGEIELRLFDEEVVA
ncbi:FliG C-terminal domain-containing protein [Burkholderia ubonensis]|uniref:FliG C-terminal domain-containing protein n=1 Tax=Burkholderia ubonensis TaxID=101571 RepID=UPI000759E9F7|nr:FliG C-terminal domain-containing protein [Burkholderia ubonensis]KWB79407.1 flagellar motor switch protein G [Burkholderia ubonensis]